MRDYGRVYSAFWTSADVQALSDDGRLLALYLLSGPHGTIAGVCRLPDGYICEDLKWTQQRVAKGFMELLREGFANRCETTKWVWICRFLAWNTPENPNQWKAARKIAATVPSNCSWNAAFRRVFAIATGDVPDDEQNPYITLPQPLPTQEQYQEQKQDTEGASQPNGKQRPKTAKRCSRIPEDFTLTSDLSAYVSKTIPDADPVAMFEKFCDQARAKAWEYADWPRALQTYCRNAAPDSGHFAAGQYPKKTSDEIRWSRTV